MRITSSSDYISRRSPVLSTRGTVATSSPQASAIGAATLAAGGTAADAAVAAAAALQVTMPCQTGLGGDCFMLYYEAATGTVHALNGSGRSPAALTLELLEQQGLAGRLPPAHAHTVTVPGAPAAWADVVARFGRLSLEQVLSPAAELAAGGYPVAPLTAGIWASAAGPLQAHRHGDELLIDGAAPRPGQIMRMPQLADSLRTLAAEGAAPFYHGDIARRVVRAVQEAGGVLSLDDLAAHQSQWVEPIAVDYRGIRVWECPPNGQGLAALIALGIFAQLTPAAAAAALPAARYHQWIQSMRLGFADAGRFVADPEHAAAPLAELLSTAYLAERADLVSTDAAVTAASPGLAAAVGTGGPAAPTHTGSDTVYLCAVDGAGNGCSFINSNYMSFGSGIVPRGCGYSLQNRGAGFSHDPHASNALAPRKRPYHTIIPGLATRANGSLHATFGVMGGFMQPQGHLQVISSLVDDDLDPQAALDRPRFQLAGRSAVDCANGELWLEPGLEAVAEELTRRGHAPKLVASEQRGGFGRGQVIMRAPDRVLWAGSDPRADGCATAVPG